MAGDGGRSQGDGSRSRMRLPTVEEALQYTPFTSIVPFNTNLIPFPTAGPPSIAPVSLEPHEASTAKLHAGVLNEALLQPSVHSPLLEHTLQNIKHLVDPSQLTSYKFSKPGLPIQTHSSPGTTNKNANIEQSELGPFAELVMSTVDIPYRYSAPVSPQTGSNVGSGKGKAYPASNVTVQIPPFPGGSSLRQSRPNQIPAVVVNKEAYLHNAADTGDRGPNKVVEVPSKSFGSPMVVIPQQPASSGFVPSPSPHQPRNTPSVVIPQPSSLFAGEVQRWPDADTAMKTEDGTPSRKRKREDDKDLDHSANNIVQLDEKAKLAKAELQRIATAILEEQDRFSNGIFGNNSSQYFSAENGGSDTVTLNRSTLTALGNSIAKAIKANILKEVDADLLHEIQTLCITVLNAFSDVDLAYPGSGSDDDIVAWLDRLDTNENALRASEILLNLIVSKKDRDKAKPEELLQQMLENIKKVTEQAIIPIIEIKASTTEGHILKTSTERKALMAAIIQRLSRILRLFSDLTLKSGLSETLVTVLEFLCIKLMFVENATFEKDSFVGVQKFESFRQRAMDVVASIFLQHPDQRNFIFDEVLSSLEKLPSTRQSARQFKIADAKPVQLVSALIMQLVQTSCIQIPPAEYAGRKRARRASAEDSDSDSSTIGSTPTKQPAKSKHISNGSVDETGAGFVDRLEALVNPPASSAEHNAVYVSKFLVQRAMTSTKSGDQPYRNLLDIFVEDFLNVLGLPEWPAAELLLRALLSSFLGLSESSQSTAPAKCMALELMGSMASTIAELQSIARRATMSYASATSSSSSQVMRICHQIVGGELDTAQILGEDGPYRAVLEFYQTFDLGRLQTKSARLYYLNQWAKRVLSMKESKTQSPADEHQEYITRAFHSVAHWLVKVIEAPQSEISDKAFGDIQTSEGRTCYVLTVLESSFCKALRRIFAVLISSMSSSQATVRSRALKSVTQLLEKDPAILDGQANVMDHILRSSRDASAMVRDSTLGLISKCLSLRPNLEATVYLDVVARAADAATGVRKRALKMLKDIYLESHSLKVRSDIADALLQRITDIEPTVAELASQTMEDIWLCPFYNTTSDISNISGQKKRELHDHLALIVATCRRSQETYETLQALFNEAIKSSSKNYKQNKEVCKLFVSTLIDEVLDNDAAAGYLSQQGNLQTLTVLAKASPEIFNGRQMDILKPYIENLQTAEDLMIYRSVVIIYRCVLPVLPRLEHSFLEHVQNVLFKGIQKLGKTELDEVSQCLWIIARALGDKTERLVKLMISVLDGIEKTKGQLSTSGDHNESLLAKLRKLIMIAGYFGKACDFDDWKTSFKTKWPKWNSASVKGLILEILVPFATSMQPFSIRNTAVESICLVCQSWPTGFTMHQVGTVLESVFSEDNPQLKEIVLDGFKNFYEVEEQRSKSGSEILPGEASQRLGKSMITTDHDSAATTIAQHFLRHIIPIALGVTESLALTAAEVIASTNRQGLVHPKECVSVIVALETSPNILISKVAFNEHQSLHAKHESMLEKEYLKAIEQAFNYQRNTIRSISGVDLEGRPKLHLFYEVLKAGNLALRKRLLANICGRIAFEISSMGSEDFLSAHLSLSRFILENLSLFDYARVDEILHIIEALEKSFNSMGTLLSQRIETELKLSTEPISNHQSDATLSVFADGHASGEHTVPMFTTTDVLPLRQFAIASMILCILWETRSFLRRTWNLQSFVKGKVKSAAKDVTKAPSRSANAAPEKHIESIATIMSSLNSVELMGNRCKALVELVSIDTEHKVGSDEDDEDHLGRPETPFEDGNPTLPGSGRSKPHLSNGFHSAASTPRKRGRPTKGQDAGLRRSMSGAMSLGDDDRDEWE